MAGGETLLRSSGDHVIQAFPLQEDNVNKGAATYDDVKMIHCATDGVFTVTWRTGNVSASIDCIAGDDYTLENAASVTVVSGTFHIVI